MKLKTLPMFRLHGSIHTGKLVVTSGQVSEETESPIYMLYLLLLLVI